MTTQIEFCCSDEFLAADLCDEYNLDHEVWLEEIANARINAAVAAAERAGLSPEVAARGQRVTFHGWSGARFTGRAGVFGWFGELTAEQEAALDRANIAGMLAARRACEEAAACTAGE